ncbi:MAG TPA: hypothetical protein VLX92_22880 [Kofleriaceae bacterium]|nr:hypothetical protein [Kofleriaceae bacterium]
MTRAAVLALALAACSPYLAAQSAAPPGRSARLDEVLGSWSQVKSYRLELSRGVAIAIDCERGGPCEHMRVASDDPQIAEVRPASLDVLRPAGFDSRNEQTASAFVVVGKAVGTTHLHVRVGKRSREVAVTVIAPPAAAVTQAAR